MLTLEEKHQLVTRDLCEVVDPKGIIPKIMDKRPLNIYWGTAPTGKIHIGYFIPLMKISDFVRAGCNVTILIADLHAFLDDMKSPENKLEFRREYYKEMITSILNLLGTDMDKIKFVFGKDFQLTPKYTMDMYKLMSLMSLNDSIKAGAEVVRKSDNPNMSGLIYPALQMLDEEYLNVDVQFGGLDQRKIFMAARDFMPKLKYKKRVHMMTPIVGGLRSKASEKKGEVLEKMSSSDEFSKIDTLDTNGIIKKKINKVFCLPQDTEDNSLLDLFKMVIFPLCQRLSVPVTINDVVYSDIDTFVSDFEKDIIYPSLLKKCVTTLLQEILLPIRTKFGEPHLKRLIKNAY